LAGPLVLISYLFWLDDEINFRKGYSPHLVRHLDPTLSLILRQASPLMTANLVHHHRTKHVKMDIHLFHDKLTLG